MISYIALSLIALATMSRSFQSMVHQYACTNQTEFVNIFHTRRGPWTYYNSLLHIVQVRTINHYLTRIPHRTIPPPTLHLNLCLTLVMFAWYMYVVKNNSAAIIQHEQLQIAGLAGAPMHKQASTVYDRARLFEHSTQSNVIREVIVCQGVRSELKLVGHLPYLPYRLRRPWAITIRWQAGHSHLLLSSKINYADLEFILKEPVNQRRFSSVHVRTVGYG